MTDIRCDVLVIGGGLIGTAVAFGLLERSLKVAIVDQGDNDNAHRAARGNFGLTCDRSQGARDVLLQARRLRQLTAPAARVAPSLPETRRPLFAWHRRRHGEVVAIRVRGGQTAQPIAKTVP